MNNDDRQFDEQDLQAPARLVSALKQVPREPIFVPPTIDRAVLDAARRQLTRPASQRNFFRPWLIWPAFAAACALLAATAYVLRSRDNDKLNIISGGLRFHYSSEDLNHDGRVDILDAFALARQVRDGQPTTSTLDLNGDGVVDRRDAEIIAAHAVKLGKGGPS